MGSPVVHAPSSRVENAPYRSVPVGFGLALLYVLFAFSGWSEVTTLSAEVRDPRRGMLRALVASIVTITLALMYIRFLYRPEDTR